MPLIPLSLVVIPLHFVTAVGVFLKVSVGESVFTVRNCPMFDSLIRSMPFTLIKSST